MTDATPTPATEALAQRLYEELERLDPGAEPFVPWSDLGERDRDLYRFCMEAVLVDRHQAEAALAEMETR